MQLQPSTGMCMYVVKNHYSSSFTFIASEHVRSTVKSEEEQVAMCKSRYQASIYSFKGQMAVLSWQRQEI